MACAEQRKRLKVVVSNGPVVRGPYVSCFLRTLLLANGLMLPGLILQQSDKVFLKVREPLCWFFVATLIVVRTSDT